MTARDYRIAVGDKTFLKRCARTDDHLSTQDLLRWLEEQVGPDGFDALVSRGVFLEWYSPETPEERAQHEALIAAAEERTEKWERETLVRLKAKYEGDQ